MASGIRTALTYRGCQRRFLASGSRVRWGRRHDAASKPAASLVERTGTLRAERRTPPACGTRGHPLARLRFLIQKKREVTPRGASEACQAALQRSTFLVEQVQNLLLCGVGLRQCRDSCLLQDRV